MTMMLEVRYSIKDKGIVTDYVSFPDRFTSIPSICDRICVKSWKEFVENTFKDNMYFVTFKAFKKDFREFLEDQFGISDNPNGWVVFLGVRPYTIPEGVQFLSK